MSQSAGPHGSLRRSAPQGSLRRSAPQSISLGRSDVVIPPLGMGTWAWGDRLVWGYGRSHGREEVEGAFSSSLEAGIRFFDTAEIYGRGTSERLLGEFGRNEESPLILATKFLPFPWRLRRQSLLGALRGSLARLGVPRIDLYQLHHILPPVPMERWLDAMADARDAGLIRAIGISNCTPDQLRRAHETLDRRGVPLASAQVLYSLLARGPERSGLLDACHELGVTLIAYSPLGMGLLTGKYTDAAPPPGLRRVRYGRWLSWAQPLLSLMQEIGKAHGGRSPAQVALNWVVSKGAVPIPGVKNARQAEENAGALGWKLSGEDVASLDHATDTFGRSSR